MPTDVLEQVSGSAVVDHFEEVAATTQLICQKDDATISAGDVYVIELTVTAGDVASIIDNTTPAFTEVSPGVFRSAEINENTATTVVVEDKNGCNTLTFADLQTKCSCPAVVDDFSLTDAEICEEGSTTISVAFSGGTGDYNVTLNQPDNSTQPDNNNSTGTSTFTVDQAGTYTVDVTSIADGNCTVSGSSITLAHFDVPEATISGGETICDDGTTALTVTLTKGTGPFSVDVKNDSPLSSVSSPQTVNVTSAATYELENLTDANGCVGTVSGSAVVDHFEEVAATTQLICQKDDATISADNVYVIELTVTAGDVASIIDNTTPAFTEVSPGVFRSAEIDENTATTVTVSDKNGCNTLTFADLQTKCSCPALVDDFSLTDTEICADGTTTITVGLQWRNRRLQCDFDTT